ncbi:MAG: hypothetical protein FJX75_09605, partial [Armatimonadetes bacterium]|nr:hypothetical protein [Armatimonadota bacterium]
MQTRWRRRLLGLLTTYRWVDLDNSGGDRRLWRGPLDGFDAVALGFIGGIALVLLLRANGLQPFVSDTYYHLAIAKQINLQGQLPAWVDWDYAPVGRPHLYPPLIHLILAGLARLTGSVLTAGQVLAVLFLPASFLSCWFATRWIFGSRAACVAVALLSLDVSHALVELIYIPSCFVNLLAPILIITLLTRRTWPSIILLTLMLYSHIAIPYLIVLGLGLFAWKYPRYRGEVLKVGLVALLWALPWVVRTWMERGWVAGAALNAGLPMGLVKRIMSLQMFNLVLVGCGLWGIRNLRRSRAQEAILRWLLLGMLPLLFSYGGRFTMHSAPFWAISASTVLVRLLPAWATWRRAAALTAATLLPSPALLPLTTTHAIVMLAVTGKPIMASDREKSEALLPDCDEAMRWVEQHTQPGDVVHTNKEWIGDLIPLLSDRRSDFGCWWECSREVGKLQNRYYRDDGRRTVFLCIRPDTDVGSILGPTPGVPAVDESLNIGRFRAAIRRERVFSLRRVIDDFNNPRPVAWECDPPASAARLTPTEAPTAPSRYVAWYIPRGAEGARITRPVSVAGGGGLALNVRASAPLGDVKLGVVEADGSDYQFALSLPCIAQAVAPERIDRALWLRIRIAFDCMSLREGGTDEDAKLDPRQITRIYLEAPKSVPRDLR